MRQPGEGYGGVGTVINGQLITGKTNCAGEIQYLPLSNEDQLKLLQTPHGTIELLSKIVVCLTAIVNPEIVAISCTNLEKASDLDETLESMVPAKYLPKIKKVTNLNDLSINVVLTGMVSGLASTGMYEMFKNLINKESE